MRVLVVHNRYRSELPSGENRVVDQEVAGLREAGVEVATYIRSSDEIAGYGPLERARLATIPIVGGRACTEVAGLIEQFRPDVMHLHNPYPLISPVVIDIAKDAGVPVVHTVHNYRQVCVKGTFFRDGGICEDCRGRAFPWPAAMHACYRDSHAQSLVMASALARHRSTWQRVDRFIAVSKFVAAHLTREGILPEKIVVKPNPVPDPGPPTPPGEGFLYLGRLDVEKGVLLLLDAWEVSGLGDESRLSIAGGGPLAKLVAQRAKELRGVTYLGQVDVEGVHELIRDHAIVVVPSIWYETFGLVVIEAFAHARPVLGTRIGAIKNIVDEQVGWLTEPTVASLARCLRIATRDEQNQRYSREARHRYETGDFARLTPDLLELFEKLVWPDVAGKAT